MKFVLIILTIITSCLTGYSQIQIDNLDSAVLFRLANGQDSIHFIKMGKSLDQKKPVLLMMQGSLPIPLVVNYPEFQYYTSFPFKVDSTLLKEYHVIAISMPHVPAVVNSDQLSANGSIKNVSKDYNRKNFLNNYVKRANSVIEYLKSQEWVTPNQFVLFGHSQGSYIAIKTAKENDQVSKIGISGCSPLGRYQQYLSNIRFEENAGTISSIEAQNRIDEYHARWKHIVKNKTNDTQERGDTFKATYSFSENFVDDITELGIPVYITYGTNDKGALGCDYLPIEMEIVGKTDYEIKAFPGLGHNFEEFDTNGNPNYEKMHWDEAFASFIDWARTKKQIMQQIQHNILIEATAEMVYTTMIDTQHFTEWVSVWNPKMTLEGSWDEGKLIKYKALDEEGNLNGMISRIELNRPNREIRIQPIGIIENNIEYFDGPKTAGLRESFDRYIFIPQGIHTELKIQAAVYPELVDFLNETWPKALQKIKRICEE